MKLAQNCLRAKSRVAVSDIDRDGGARVAKEIEEAGGTARFLEHDVTSEARWQEVVAQTVAAFGGLHILVNNAGIGVGGLCENFSLEDWAVRRQSMSMVFFSVQARHSRDARIGQRLHRYHVLGCRTFWRSRYVGLLRDEGGRAAVREGRRTRDGAAGRTTFV